MSQLEKIFNYEGHQVRTVLIDKEPWFVAKDVCEILKHSNSRVALNRLDEDEKGVSKVYTPGGIQEMLVINEFGLYSLVLTSNLSEAKSFKRWVTHDVIPSVRQKGSYIQPQSIEDLIIMQAQSVKEIKAEVNQIKQLTDSAHHRLDNIDKIDIIGNQQQRLNKIIKKYAYAIGATIPKAWTDFVDCFNRAYHTNLTLRVSNYKTKFSLKNLTTPQYLSLTNNLEDAIRVADKMLNKVMNNDRRNLA